MINESFHYKDLGLPCLKSVKSIYELAQLGENEIDPDIFARKFKQKKYEAFENNVANEGPNKTCSTNIDEWVDSEVQSDSRMIKFKNLNREIQFITAGYFDFNSMIWKDEIDGRTLNSTQWYQEQSHYLRKSYN